MAEFLVSCVERGGRGFLGLPSFPILLIAEEDYGGVNHLRIRLKSWR